jgi:hypothetical protein
MIIAALEEPVDFATLDNERLFSKLKSHELSHKGHPNHDASLSRKALITDAHVGGHDANPTNTTVSSALEFALSSLVTDSNEQYESIPDNEIALLARKFHTLHKLCKKRRRSPKGCFECDDTTHFIDDCPKRKKLDSYPTSTTTPSGMTTTRVTTRRSTALGQQEEQIPEDDLPSVCCLSDLEFSNDDSSNSEQDEKVKHKLGDFTSLYLMGKSSK